MADAAEKHILIVHESVLKSWANDAGTFVMFSGLIGLGWLIDSTALQWVGAIIGFITIAVSSKKMASRCTLPEARERLDEIEGVA